MLAYLWQGCLSTLVFHSCQSSSSPLINTKPFIFLAVVRDTSRSALEGIARLWGCSTSETMSISFVNNQRLHFVSLVIYSLFFSPPLLFPDDVRLHVDADEYSGRIARSLYWDLGVSLT